MSIPKKNEFVILKPDLQVSFYHRLNVLKERYFFKALKRAIEKMDIGRLDGQLSKYVKAKCLNKLASFGIRGEVFFPIPLVLEVTPFLLGYYRLLFGFSQKEFYHKGPFGRFKVLEERGEIPERLREKIKPLSISLIGTGCVLVDMLDDISLATVHELQLLTLGPQLRGSENTRLGKIASKEVFELINKIVSPYVRHSTARTIQLENESGRLVLIEFSNDPDISIMEKLESDCRPLVSIEIKGGGDVSNIHNRLGEAEKSHQKAKSKGFFEFWTILRVPVDSETVKRESPTTTYSFHLDRITDPTSSAHRLFREMLGSILGIKT